MFLENKKFPAGLLVIIGGIVVGATLGNFNFFKSVSPGLYFPAFLPGRDFLPGADFTFALMALVLAPDPHDTWKTPSLLTLIFPGDYFGKDAEKVTYRAACISMSFANFISFLMGGIPLCHGAGGPGRRITGLVPEPPAPI